MSIERTFDLIINAGTSSPLIINANQNDSGEIWKFNLYQEDGTKVIPAAGEIVGLKSDGHAIVNAGVVNPLGQVVITETEQMTAAPGANVYEIVFDSVHGTANFIVYVEKSPVDDDADFSESDISAIQQAIAMAIDSATVQAIQNGLAQESATRATQDAQLAGDISEEAATRAAADALLQTEIDQIIAPSGEAPSAAEVENARIGADGTVYDTLGNAIRGQVSDLDQEINQISERTRNLIFSNQKTATPVNVTVVSNGDGTFKVTGTADSNGGRTTRLTDVITIPAGTYTLSAPNDSLVSSLSVFLNDSTTNNNFASVTPGGTPQTFTLTEQTSFYVGFGLSNGVTYDLSINVQLEEGTSVTDFVPSVTAKDSIARITASEVKEKFDSGITLEDVTFSTATQNKFDANFEENIRIDSQGRIVEEVSPNIAAERDYIAVDAQENYCFYERNMINYPGTFNVVISYYNSSKEFISQEIKGNTGVVRFTTPQFCSFVRFYLYRANIAQWLSDWVFVLCEGNNPLPAYVKPYLIDKDYIERASDLNGKNVLIFGDSITDCCDITVNESNQTTAYSFRNPSNSYVNGGGETVRFSMWPKILTANKSLFDVRNYAKFGATYKDGTPSAGNERQNVSYQIQIAENDINNPNGVFPTVGAYKPDIVIFSLGTNDGVPNDTPSSALSKLVRDADTTINVAASLANMDRSKFCEAVLWAFLKVKSLFPMAQCFCVTPLQSANRNTIPGTLHDYLKEMAERYNYIVIDGSYTSGITRELNNAGALGEYLIDGLHPNEKGQNMMARMIISALERNYMSFDETGFNELT